MPLPEGYKIPASDGALLAECDVQVFRASGPGGQSVNTTDSAVRLVHRPTGVRVQSQQERSQLRNKQICIKRLREKLEASAYVAPERKKTRPSRAAKARRRDAKGRRSVKKQSRQAPGIDEDW